MRHFLAVAVAALAIGAAAIPAQADQTLSSGGELATTQPRDNVLATQDRLAYDVDFTAGHGGPAPSKG
jgi:hypothetical protein